MLLPLQPQTVEMQQMLRTRQVRAREDHRVGPREGVFPQADPHPNQTQIPTLRHPLPARTAQPSL
jgi:hypothetical protein